MTHYEALRAAVVSPKSDPHALVGMGVLLVRGMMGWIDALPALSTRVPEPVAAEAPHASSGLVRILADMATSRLGVTS